MHLIVGDFSVFMGKLQLKEQTNKPLRATITRIYYFQFSTLSVQIGMHLHIRIVYPVFSSFTLF